MAEDMITRGAVALTNWWRSTPAEDRISNVGAARAILLAALDPPREEIYAISDESSVSFELVCSVLMALRRRAQGERDG